MRVLSRMKPEVHCPFFHAILKLFLILVKLLCTVGIGAGWVWKAQAATIGIDYTHVNKIFNGCLGSFAKWNDQRMFNGGQFWSKKTFDIGFK